MITFLLLSTSVNAQQTLLLGNSFNPAQKVLTHNLIAEAYKRLHINVTFIFLPAERSAIAANNADIDGDVARVEGLEKSYPNLLRVKTPLTHILLYACSKNKNFSVTGWRSLKPYRIAYLRSSIIVGKNLQGFRTESVTSMDQAFAMLEADRVDVVVANQNGLITFLPKYPSIKALTPPIYSFPVYHYLHKKHANLIAPLEKVLQEMTDDKTIARIEREFMIEQNENRTKK